jgi:hypothetical protein
MSQRAHFWIRLVALGVIVAVALLPRSERHARGLRAALTVLDASDPGVEVAPK